MVAPNVELLDDLEERFHFGPTIQRSLGRDGMAVASRLIAICGLTADRDGITSHRIRRLRAVGENRRSDPEVPTVRMTGRRGRTRVSQAFDALVIVRSTHQGMKVLRAWQIEPEAKRFTPVDIRSLNCDFAEE